MTVISSNLVHFLSHYLGVGITCGIAEGPDTAAFGPRRIWKNIKQTSFSHYNNNNNYKVMKSFCNQITVHFDLKAQCCY